MSCTYTYQGKTYTAWEFADLLESMPVEELMKYLPAEAAYKLVQASEGNVKNWYFSQLFRAVNTASDKVFGQAANVKNWIEANAGKMGVKKDELQWTGVLDWLDMKGKERVSKADVLDYLRGNGVQVQEVMKGEDEIAKIQAKIDAINEEFNALVDRFGPIPDMPTDAKAEIDRLTAEHDELADQMSAMHPSDFATKYGPYTLPGGENYRELLLTLPAKEQPLNFTPLTELPEGYAVSFDRTEPEGRQYSVIPPGQIHGAPYGGWRAGSVDEAKQGALSILNSELDNKARDERREQERGKVYRSSHWEEKNILAHIRFNDRVDADGAKVLFIEEIQSDLAQDKRRGKTDFAGPFIDDTKAWVSLAMKRMIAYAVENGYDKVAFVNGEQSAERYDLSKSISKVTWMPEGNGGLLMADDINGNSVLNNRLKDASEIEDYVGKDVAKRLLETKPRYDAYTAEQIHELSGLDLKVGGEGMKTFYNQIVPQVANDLLKKLGGKIESVSIDVAEEDLVVPKEEQTPEWSDQLGFSITPEMREKASGGLPLFSKRELHDTIEVDGKSRPTRNSNGKLIHPTEEGIRNFWRWFGDSRVVDGQGRPLVVYHGTTADVAKFDLGFSGADGVGYDIPAIFATTDQKLANDYAINKFDREIADAMRSMQRFKNENPGVYNDEYERLYKAVKDSFAKQRDGLRPELGGGANVVPLYMRGNMAEVNADGERFMAVMPKALPDAMAHGKDGVIVNNVIDNASPATDYPARVFVSFAPENVKSATGNNGDFNGSNPNIQASIDFSIKDKIDSAVEKASKLRDRLERSDSLIQNKIAHAFDTVIGAATGDTAKTFNWYHKGPGSQYHKAQIDADYNKVYSRVDEYTKDIARHGTEAADMAPNLLPKMDTLYGALKEVRYALRDKKDQEKIAAPIYEGTLNYMRDENGELVKTEDVDAAGVVFTDKELADLFGLDERQRGLYREFRKAVDKSLETLAVAEINKVANAWGLDTPIEVMEMDALADHYYSQVEGEIETLQQELEELKETQASEAKILEDAAGDEVGDTEKRTKYANQLIQMRARHSAQMASLTDRLNELMKFKEGIVGKAETITNLKNKGYAPLMRFGKYTVTVQRQVPERDERGYTLVDQDGKPKMTNEIVFFGMFESENAARAAQRILKEEYPDCTVDRGVSSEDGWQLFGGTSLDAIEKLVELVGKDDEAVQKFYKTAVSSRSALKRLIHRQGIEGYNKDVVRSLASFIMSNARATAATDHFGAMIEAANSIPKEKGDVKDEAIRMLDYIRNPNEEAGTLRGILFAQFLGGSLASALVNLTQSITTTFPFLHQYGVKTTDIASAGILAAKRMGGKAATGIDQELANALKRAEDNGDLKPHEVHMLMGQAGNGLQGLAGNRGLRMMSHLWGSFFGMAEQFNRETAFIAAFKQAQQMGDAGLKKAYQAKVDLWKKRGITDEYGNNLPDPKPFSNAYEFAKHCVDETQFVPTKAARSNWSRGPVGATLMTFKAFSVMYLELFKRMPNKERAIMLSTLIILAGLGGLPFDDDLDDLIDTLGQAMGYNTNMNRWKDTVLVDVIGQSGSDFVMHGISAFIPIELSTRLGMSNLVPASGFLKRSNSGNREREFAELLGPAGGFLKQVTDAWDYTLKEKYDEAIVYGIAPKAIRDAYKGYKMATTGLYDDSRGRRITDVDGIDSLIKFVGFQPTAVSGIQRTKGQVQQDVNLVKAVKSAISEIWAQGNYDRDQELRAKAQRLLAEWNEKNPEATIKIDRGAIQRRVKQMGMTAQDRLVKTTPKEMRESVRKSFE